ncbi:hypothetical protein [Haloarcula nitratireducens]|uniref:DUF2795 domain-containing protein n=1 Tax=Haloarcula nitratireducens TaxID=2487749 RepID=A0AAW4PIU7_9EURY|nr:hypothetical protein [Halomicroarcula nitratireducens]MBX0298052.1 hypothetical protein [Halomicroarcula nitratireducens]
MRYSETQQLFEQAFTFPADRDAVIEQLGTVELMTPAGDAVTLGEVLERTDEATYNTPDELYTSLVGNLEDGFIGRKYYDDRGGIEAGVDDVRTEDVSF